MNEYKKMLLKDALQFYEPSILFEKLKAGDLIAEGVLFQESMTEAQQLNEEYQTIPRNLWSEYKVHSEENRISKLIELDVEGAQSLHQEYSHIYVLVPLDQKAPLTQVDTREYSYINFIGALSKYLEEKKFERRVQAKEVWSYLAKNYRYYPDYVSDYENKLGDEWFVFKSQSGKLGDMQFQRFSTILSEFNTGKRTVDGNLDSIFHG